MVIDSFFKQIFKESGKGKEPNKNGSVELISIVKQQNNITISKLSISFSL